MNKVILEIDSQNIEISFGYGTLRRLGELWGVKTVSAVFEKFQAFASEGEPTLEQLSLLGDIVSVSAANAGFIMDSDYAVDVLLNNPNKMVEIIQAFIASLPIDSDKKKQEIKSPKKNKK